MGPRPMPGTAAEDIYLQLIGQVSRAGRRVDLPACAQLAELIQERGHRDGAVRTMAQALGLDPRWLPRQRPVR